jgi:hypothetical protein
VKVPTTGLDFLGLSFPTGAEPSRVSLVSREVFAER